MTMKRLLGLPGFQAKLTPPENRPYSAEVLYSICEDYAPFVLGAVRQLEESQRQFDESEGNDDKAAMEVGEQAARIWQAIEYGTNRSRAIGRTSTEPDVWYDNPAAQPFESDPPD